MSVTLPEAKDILKDVQTNAVQIQRWQVKVAMDLDFKDRRLKELEVLVEASQEELKSVTVQLSVAERNLDALSIEANSLQKDTKEAEVGQELAVEELKALKKWVDCQSQTFDLLEAFYKETVEALINVDRNTELSKDNEAKNFKRIKKVLGERFQELEHYEKDIEAKKENESSRLENLRHQNLESTEKARSYERAIAELQDIYENDLKEMQNEMKILQSSIDGLKENLSLLDPFILQHNGCPIKMKNIKEGFTNSVDKLQAEMQKIDEINEKCKGEITLLQSEKDHLLYEIKAEVQHKNQKIAELQNKRHLEAGIIDAQQETLELHWKCAETVISIQKELDEAIRAAQADKEEHVKKLNTIKTDSEVTIKDLNTNILKKEEEKASIMQTYNKIQIESQFNAEKLEKLRSKISEAEKRIDLELLAKEKLINSHTDLSFKEECLEKELVQIKDRIGGSIETNKRLKEEEIKLNSQLEDEKMSVSEASESLLKMENSYADFEREKKTEIEALKTDLSDSEEAIKNNRWAYDEHLMCQQKISSANISNRQIFEELKCEVESLRKNYFQKKEECKGLEDSIVQIRKKVEQAMCEKLDKFEKLKESLVDAEETIRSQMEAVIEHKLCVQRLSSLRSIIDQKKKELEKTTRSFEEQALKSSKENEAFLKLRIDECENLRGELATERIKAQRLSMRNESLQRELDATKGRDLELQQQQSKESEKIKGAPAVSKEAEFVIPNSKSTNFSVPEICKVSKTEKFPHSGTPRPITGAHKYGDLNHSVRKSIWDDSDEEEDDDPFCLPKEESLKTLGKYKSIHSSGGAKAGPVSDLGPDLFSKKREAPRRKLFDEKPSKKRSYTRNRGRKS